MPERVGDTVIYGIYVKGMVFKQFGLGKGVEIRGFGSRIGCHFQETDQLIEDVSLD